MRKLLSISGLLVALVLTMNEASMIAGIVFSEANTESELGKRLVVDCILNRVDDSEFPDTVAGVLTQPGQFARGGNILDDDVNLVLQEAGRRTNADVLWFRRGRYHSFGDPIVKEGRHYFSGR